MRTFHRKRSESPPWVNCDPALSVNLEKALRLDSRLGGHLVSGHVDCVGSIAEKRPTGNGFLMGFAVDSTRYLIEKGAWQWTG